MFGKLLRPWRKPRPLSLAEAQLVVEASGAQFDLSALLTGARARNEAMIRGLARSAFLGDATAVCRVLGRYRLFVDTRDVGLSVHLLTDGFWEMPHTEALMQLVKPGMVAADLGANLGYFTVLLSELVGADGRVHAFEPNPALAALLTSSVEINGFASRTTVHACALGESDQTGALRVPPGQPKNAWMVAPERRREDDVEVPVRSLDSLPELAEVDFLKIDVEGAERDIWRGMSALIASGRPLTIVLEFRPVRYSSPAEFLDEILAAGFSLATIDDAAGIVSVAREHVLSQPPKEDQLLVLRR
jgi:FkbM family methyltransferase